VGVELDLIIHVDKVRSPRQRGWGACANSVRPFEATAKLRAHTATPPLPTHTPARVALQVHYILDEIVMGGMVLETNIGGELQQFSRHFN